MGKVKVEKDNSERWLLTYADLMNLLLILFIILFAMSQVDSEKFQQLSQSLSSAFGNGNPPSTIQGGKAGNSLISMPGVLPSPVIPSTQEDQQFDETVKEVDNIVKEQGLDGNVSVNMQERGIVISIRDKVLFKSGSAEIEKDSEADITKIGQDILAKIPGKSIRIEGHTDNNPIKSNQFPSNWELSSARATNVLRLLVEKAGLDPKNTSAVGYGEFTPVVPNTSDENRAINRRVDIVILRDAFGGSEANANNTSATPTK